MTSRRFVKRDLIGAGTFGKVYVGVCRETGVKYAMKVLLVSGLSKKDLQQVMTEVSVLAYSKHVNIIRYKTAFVESGLLNVVMEYADDGDLHERIQSQKRLSQHLPEELILNWFVQICSGICYLHGKNILHRDLKTQNIFLTKNQTVKIGDFGISKILESTADHAQTAVGTPYFLSPEICQRLPYNQKSDMWAIGCVLYELSCLQYPFIGEDFNQLVVTILHGKYKPLPDQYSSLLRDLVAVLLQAKSEQRPSAEKVLCIPDLKVYMDAYIKHLQTSMPGSPRPRDNQANQVNQANQANQVNQANQANQVNQANQAGQAHQANQANQANKENMEPRSRVLIKPRKHSLVTPRIRLPLKEKRCYSNQENSTTDQNKRPKLSIKPAPVSSLYKKAITQRRNSIVRNSQQTRADPPRTTPDPLIITDPPNKPPTAMDTCKSESRQQHNSDVEMNEEVFEPSPQTPSPGIVDSTTYTIVHPRPPVPLGDVMNILVYYGLTGKNNLQQTSEGLRYFLEQRMGCDRFFRLYLSLKDLLQAPSTLSKFTSCMEEAGDFWPVLYHLVQIDHIFESL